MRKKVLPVLLALVVLFAGGAAIAFWRGIRGIQMMEIGEINPGQVADGVYPGSIQAGPIGVELTVTVAGGKITAIDIQRHDHGRGAAGEKITDRIIAEQSLQVDTISGATYSSKVILKAVEKALGSG
ncbi:MAG TPA: FMN-binding protein [Firmicutes bacterium]|nr:FMN-binding protein [Bacillota bacterium]